MAREATEDEEAALRCWGGIEMWAEERRLDRSGWWCLWSALVGTLVVVGGQGGVLQSQKLQPDVAISDCGRTVLIFCEREM